MAKSMVKQGVKKVKSRDCIQDFSKNEFDLWFEHIIKNG